MNNFEKSSLKSLIKHMEIISKAYFVDRTKQHEYCLYDSYANRERTPKEIFIDKVEKSYEGLNTLEKLIINNDFFYEEYDYWWDEIFSKKSYLFLKKKAIVHFLKSFYEE